MLQGFDERGHLPQGIHLPAWPEFKKAFGYSDQGRDPIEGMRMALLNLKRARCLAAYIDGSFVTQKFRPADHGGCREPANVDMPLAGPARFDSSHGRHLQKLLYKSELFPEIPNPDGKSALKYFQTDMFGNAKGIAMIRSGDLDD